MASDLLDGRRDDDAPRRRLVERLLEHVDVRRVHVRAVEREAVGEALAVVRQQLVEEVEPAERRLAAHARGDPAPARPRPAAAGPGQRARGRERGRRAAPHTMRTCKREEPNVSLTRGTTLTFYFTFSSVDLSLIHI